MKLRHFFIACALALCNISGQLQAHSGGNYVHSDMVESLQANDKAALLMVYFGTTHDDTRKATIDAMTEKAKAAFPSLTVYEAYTSRIVKRRLEARGIKKMNPIEALAQLKADGFTHVIIQATNIIDGVEMESLRKDIAQMEPLFKEIRLGTPLLYSPEDYEKVIQAVLPRKQDGAMNVLVGHGTYAPETAQYAMFAYMLQTEGHEDFTVATVEGYPTFDMALAYLDKHAKTKKVQLIPFMFVAGDHAKNDINGEMRETLEARGYTVSTLLEGLGQQSAIQELFLNHIRFALHHKLIDISEKKKEYAAGKDVH